MRKAKGRRSEAQNPKPVEESVKEETGGFFACYLLCSLSPSHKGHTYIGFTINPRRRIRQHNGEIRCGAWRTKKKRPWEMILCIYGFPSNVSALQFEWAWQHPRESLAVRKAAASLESLSRKSLSRITKNIKLAYTMLTLPAWQNLKVTVNFFSTKYMKYAAGCPTLPEQMHVQVCPMDELPCYVDNLILENDDDDDEDENLNDDNGHEKNAMDMSANQTWADQHNIEKVATSDLFPLIEEHDFVHSPSTPKVNTLSSVNFRSSSGKNIWEWNGEGNVGQSMQQTSMPGADRNPLSSISILSPEVYVGNTLYNMEKVATGNLFPSIDEQAFEISPSNPRTNSRQSSVDFRYSSKDIQECNGEGNPRQSMEQQFTPTADNNPLSSISILSPEVSVGRSIQILDNYPISCFVSPGSIFKEDMQTPLPLRCRIRSFSKSAPTYPEIIDLTDSPNFIQL